MNYFWAFCVGGGICVVGQLLIDLTGLTPARILTGYVVAGVVLSAIGWYAPLAEFAGCGVCQILFSYIILQQTEEDGCHFCTGDIAFWMNQTIGITNHIIEVIVTVQCFWCFIRLVVWSMTAATGTTIIVFHKNSFQYSAINQAFIHFIFVYIAQIFCFAINGNFYFVQFPAISCFHFEFLFFNAKRNFYNFWVISFVQLL